MGSKHNDCCCCPNCTYRVELCCPCVCPAICVTFTPSDPECDPTSVEFDWDESISGYQGSLVGHDLYYYIAREQLTGSDGRKRGKCRFWLRSDSLGYPEGYEMYWEIPCTPDPTVGTATSGENDDPTECTTCLRLGTSLGVPADNVGTSTAVVPCSAGTITTECVNWVTPTNCNNCFCLCECLCAVVKKDGITYTGKLCWDGITGTGTDDPNRWVGTLTGEDSTGSERSLYVEVPVDRWGDVCVGTSTGTGTGTGDCNPDDDSCAISVTITADDDSVYVGDWQRMAEPCELRAVEYSWQIVYPGTSTSTPEDDIYVDIWCAICNEVCEPVIDVPCCPGLSLPTSLHCDLQLLWKIVDEPPEYMAVVYELILSYDADVEAWMGEVCADPPPESLETEARCAAVAFGYDRDAGICYFAASPSPNEVDWRSDPFEYLWPVYTSDLASWIIHSWESWPTPLPTYDSESAETCIVHLLCDPFWLFIGNPPCELPSDPVDVSITLRA